MSFDLVGRVRWVGVDGDVGREEKLSDSVWDKKISTSWRVLGEASGRIQYHWGGD